MTKIDIAVACGQSQHFSWWGKLLGVLLQEQKRGIDFGQIMAVGSALPDFNKNNQVGGWRLPPFGDPNQKGRNEKTDANRGVLANRFLGGSVETGWKAEWLMWFDDDVVVPENIISDLLDLDKEAAAGLYFNPNKPYNPIAYFRNKDGIGYDALYDYPFGSLIQVDSVGMGCTLVHRSVYEKIMAEHVIYVRPNGSYMPVHKDKVRPGPKLETLFSGMSEAVIDGYHVMKVQPPADDDNRAWPFYSMEYGRTEDHHFWELAAAVGVRPWVDTRLICGHIKPQQMTYEKYREALNDRKNLSSR